MRTMTFRRSAVAILLAGLAAFSVLADDLHSPEAIRARIAAAGDADRYSTDTVIVLDDADVTVQPDGIGVARYRTITKILRPGGIRSAAIQKVDFDPQTNRVELKAVRVYRGNGTIEDGPRNVVFQPSPAGSIYWSSEQMVVSVPRLNVGDALELEYTKTGFNMAYLAEGGASSTTGMQMAAGAESLTPPMPGHWHDEVAFYAWTPICEKRYTVRLPVDKPLQYAVYNGALRSSVTLDGKQVVYRFVATDISPYHREPQSASPRDTQCKLVLATVPDWETKARWFYKENEKSFALTDELKAKAREITADCRSDDEKITALNHWVAENIRYVGTSRGACEGYTTHPADETLRDRGGVCKDKAGLLVALLRAAGFKSYIVMTQAGTRVERIPADQFNHAVTAVELPDGQLRLLDPTWMPKSRDNWSTAEPIQNVVYGTPEGRDLDVSPYFPPEDNLGQIVATTRISADGSAAIVANIRSTGRPETVLRRQLAGDTADERVARAAGWLRAVSPDLRAVDVSLMDPVDFTGPYTAKVSATAMGVVLGDDGRRFFRLPLLTGVLHDEFIGEVDGSYAAEKRTLPIRLRATRRLILEETITLPAGWQATKLPEPVSLDGPAAMLSFEITESGATLHYKLQVDLKQHIVPVEDYANYRQVLERFDEISNSLITCSALTRISRN